MVVMHIARIFVLVLIGGLLVAWMGLGPVKVLLMLLLWLWMFQLKLENRKQFRKSYC